MATLIDCPACGGDGWVLTEAEGDRPMVRCDMCEGKGRGILDPEACDCTCHDSEAEAIECLGGCHEFYGKPS